MGGYPGLPQTAPQSSRDAAGGTSKLPHFEMLAQCANDQNVLLRFRLRITWLSGIGPSLSMEHFSEEILAHILGTIASGRSGRHSGHETCLQADWYQCKRPSRRKAFRATSPPETGPRKRYTACWNPSRPCPKKEAAIPPFALRLKGSASPSGSSGSGAGICWKE